jgi:hypothetical protein
MIDGKEGLIHSIKQGIGRNLRSFFKILISVANGLTTSGLRSMICNRNPGQSGHPVAEILTQIDTCGIVMLAPKV